MLATIPWSWIPQFNYSLNKEIFLSVCPDSIAHSADWEPPNSNIMAQSFCYVGCGGVVVSQHSNCHLCTSAGEKREVLIPKYVLLLLYLLSRMCLCDAAWLCVVICKLFSFCPHEFCAFWLKMNSLLPVPSSLFPCACNCHRLSVQDAYTPQSFWPLLEICFLRSRTSYFQWLGWHILGTIHFQTSPHKRQIVSPGAIRCNCINNIISFCKCL